MPFLIRNHGTPEFEFCDEELVSMAFEGLTELHHGGIAKKNTVTRYLKKNPGLVRGAPIGDFIYIVGSESDAKLHTKECNTGAWLKKAVRSREDERKD